MSKVLLQKAKEMMILWQLAKWKIILNSIVTLGIAWQATTANIKLSSLDRWDMINVFVAMFVLWGDKIQALMDKTAGEIVDGRFPGLEIDPAKTEQLISSDTLIIKKDEIKITTTNPQP